MGQLHSQDRNKTKQLIGRKALGNLFQSALNHNGKLVSMIINLIFWHNVTFRNFGNYHYHTNFLLLHSQIDFVFQFNFMNTDAHGHRLSVSDGFPVSLVSSMDTIYQGL